MPPLNSIPSVALFDLIDNNFDGKNNEKIILALRKEWQGRIAIQGAWGWAPGDTIGAKLQDNRKIVLGRIYFEGRPSAHFLILWMNDARWPLFLVHNSQSSTTFGLSTCMRDLPEVYTRCRRIWVNATRHKGGCGWRTDTRDYFVGFRTFEMIKSCDSLEKSRAAVSAPTPAVENHSSPINEAPPEYTAMPASTPSQPIENKGFSSGFLARHLTEEQRETLETIPRETPGQQKFFDEMVDALVYASLSAAMAKK